MKTKVAKILIILFVLTIVIGMAIGDISMVKIAKELEEIEISKTNTKSIEDKLKSKEVILESEMYLITNENISRVKPQTSYEEFIKTIKVQIKEEYKDKVKVYNNVSGEKQEVTTGIITTGMILAIEKDGEELEKYEIIVTGDMTQNGDTSIIELTKITKHVIALKDWILKGIEEKAREKTIDGKITIDDIKEVIRYIVYGVIEVGNGEKIEKPEIEIITSDGEEEKLWYNEEVTVKIKEIEEKETQKTVYQKEGYKAEEGKWKKIEEKGEIEGKEKTVKITEDGIYKIISQTYGKESIIEGGLFEENNSRSNKSEKTIRIDKVAPTAKMEEVEEGKEIEIKLEDNIGLESYIVKEPNQAEETEWVILEETTNEIVKVEIKEAGKYEVIVKDIAGNTTTESIDIEIEEPEISENPDVPQEPETYTVTWVNEDGTELETDENVVYGTMPEFNGETPTKAATAQYTYTFAGWTPEVTEVTKDVTYTAIYTETVNEYTVTFKNWDGEVLKTEEVEYGSSATAPENPTRPEEEGKYFEFKSWDKDFTNITEDTVVTAQYEEKIYAYIVIFYDEDGETKLAEVKVNHGETAVYDGKIPTKEQDVQYTYVFTKWVDKEGNEVSLENITEDKEVYASYEKALRKYTVTFVDDDGITVLKTCKYDYGTKAEDIEQPETPTKARDAEYSYTFAGWEPEISEVEGDVTYKATYTETVNKYTVTYTDGVEDEEIFVDKIETVEYGTVIPAYSENGEAPRREGYTFTGWKNENTGMIIEGVIVSETVTGDVIYTAQWKEITPVAKILASEIIEDNIGEIICYKNKNQEDSGIPNEEYYYFPTLSSAIAVCTKNADSQTTIIMLENVTETNTIDNGKNIKIQLNGKEIKCVGEEETTIINNSKLQIVNNSEEGGIKSENHYAIINNAEITIGEVDEEEKEPNKIKPRIEGQEIGLKVEAGTLNFYDGIIIGKIAISHETVNDPNTPENYVIVTTKQETGEKLEATLGQIVDAVAKIEDKYYTKLSAAISSVPNNLEEATEIVILKNITLEETQEIPESKNIILNLNSWTIDRLNSSASTIYNKGILEVVDESTAATGTIKNIKATAIENEKTLKISGGKIFAQADGMYINAIYNNSTGTLTILGGEISVTGNSMNQTDKADVIHNLGKVEVLGGKISTTGYMNLNAIYNNGKGEVIITGGEISMTTSGCVIYNDSEGKVIVSGGIIRDTGYSGYGIYNNSTEEVIVSNVEITLNRNVICNEGVGTVKVIQSKLNTTTGGLSGIHNYGKGKVIVNQSTIKATGIGIYNKGQGIVEVSESTVIATGFASYGIHNKGTVVVKDESTVSVSGDSSYGIYNEGTAEVSGSEVIATSASSPRETYGIYNANQGTVEVSGSEVIATADNYAYGIYNTARTITEGGEFVAGVTVSKSTVSVNGSEGKGISNAEGGTVTVKDESTVNALGYKSQGIYNAGQGIVKISGSEVSARSTAFTDNAYGIYNAGTVTIGTKDAFVVNTPAITGAIYGIYNQSGILNFYDGEIKGLEAIHGGRVVDVEQDSDGNFYEIIKETEDDMEKLTLRKEPIASRTKGEQTIEYANIQDLQIAIKEAEEKITIKILRDIIIPEAITPIEQETDIVIPPDKNIILDLNGKIVKGSKTGVIKVENNAMLEVMDDSGENTGAIWQTAKDESEGYKKAIINKGTLRIISGNIVSAEIAILNENKVELIGGFVDGEDYGIYSAEGSEGKVSGGIVYGGISNLGTLTVSEEGLVYEGISNSGILTVLENGAVYGGISSSGTVTIGTKSGEVSDKSPIIKGSEYGIYNFGGTFNFYDGVIEGETAIKGKIADLEENYDVIVTKKYEESVIEKAILAIQPVAKVLVGRIDEKKLDEIDTIFYKKNEEYYYFNTLDICIQTVKADNESTNIEILRNVLMIDTAPVIEIRDGQNIVLDLQGYTIQKDGDTIISNQGTLEIVDETKEKQGTIKQLAEGTIEEYKKAILNEGILTVTSGTVISTRNYGIGIYNSSIGKETESGEIVLGLTVKGGLVSATGSDGIGIYNEGTLTVSEDGNISATGSNGIGLYNAKGGTVEVIGTIITNSGVYQGGVFVKIEVIGGTVSATGSNGIGIYNAEGGKVKASGTITVNSEESTIEGVTVEVIGDTVSATGSAGRGIYNEGTLTISEGSIVSGYDCGIYNAKEGTVEMIGGIVRGNDYGLYNAEAGTVEVTGGTVSVTGSNGYGIYNIGITTVSEGATVRGYDGYGIYNVEGGTVEVTAGLVSGNIGIYNKSAGILTETGKFVAGVTVSGGTVSGYRFFGIYNAEGCTVEITGGTVSGDTAYGIYNNSEGVSTQRGENVAGVTVRGGTVSAKGNNGYGIYNDVKCTVTVGTKGGELSTGSPEIIGTKYGIYNPSGILNFYDGVIKGSEAIYGRVVNVEKDEEGNFYEIIKETEDDMEKLTLRKEPIASITKGEETIEYANIQDLQIAINEAEEKTTIKILRDIIIIDAIIPTEQETDIVIPSDKNIILDLNGKTVKGSKMGVIKVEKNATLEVIDNSGENTGSIIQTAKDESKTIKIGNKNAIINKGILIVTSGKIDSADGAILNEGILTIEKGEVIGNYYGIFNNSAGVFTEGKEFVAGVTLSGGTVSGGIVSEGILSGPVITETGNYAYGIYNAEGGTVKVSGGTVSGGIVRAGTVGQTNDVGSAYGIYNAEAGKVEVSGGIVNATSNGTNGYKGYEYGIYNEDGSTVNVSGGTVSATSGYGYGIYNAGRGRVRVAEGGAVSGNSYGIYNAGQGIVTVAEGGTVSATGIGLLYNGGYEYRIYGIYNAVRGTVEVNGGTVSITGSITGMGMYYVYGIYNEGMVKVLEEGTVSVEMKNSSGMVITANYGIYNLGTAILGLRDGKINSTTPVITGTSYGIYNENGIFNFYDGIIKGSNSIYSIGTINKEIGYKIQKSKESSTSLEQAVLEKDSEETSVALIGEKQFFDNLESAIASVPDNTETTIYLLQDIEFTRPIEILSGKNIILDLNGHTITNLVNGPIITNNGTLTIKDSIGTITEIGTIDGSGTTTNLLNSQT